MLVAECFLNLLSCNFENTFDPNFLIVTGNGMCMCVFFIFMMLILLYYNPWEKKVPHLSIGI